MTSHRTRFFHALCGIGYADKMAIGQLNQFVHILFKSGFFFIFTFLRFFWSSVYNTFYFRQRKKTDLKAAAHSEQRFDNVQQHTQSSGYHSHDGSLNQQHSIQHGYERLESFEGTPQPPSQEGASSTHHKAAEAFSNPMYEQKPTAQEFELLTHL